MFTTFFLTATAAITGIFLFCLYNGKKFHLFKKWILTVPLCICSFVVLWPISSNSRKVICGSTKKWHNITVIADRVTMAHIRFCVTILISWITFFSRDSTTRFVRFSVGRSVTFYFFLFHFLTPLLLPKWSSDLKYGPCPPARNFGSRVCSLVWKESPYSID